MNVTTELAAGQKPLLTKRPCNCDGEEAQMASLLLHDICMQLQDRLCPIATGTVLCMVAASLVNPVNIKPDNREAGKTAALIVADVMETIAKGIRERASDA